MRDFVRNVTLDEHRIIHGITIRHYFYLSTTDTAVSVLSELQGSNISCLAASVSGYNMSAVSDSLALMAYGNSSQSKSLEEALTRTAVPARAHVSSDTDKPVLFRNLSVAFSDFDGLGAGA